jgi:hypothetical protein
MEDPMETNNNLTNKKKHKIEITKKMPSMKMKVKMALLLAKNKDNSKTSKYNCKKKRNPHKSHDLIESLLFYSSLLLL